MSHADHEALLPPFRPECRTSGVLLHVTSLASPYGIGDVGPVAFSWKSWNELLGVIASKSDVLKQIGRAHV